MREAVVRAQNNDPQGVVSVLRHAVASPAFSALPEPQRYAGTFLLGAALYETNAIGEAYPLLRQASEIPQATGHTWNLLLGGARRARLRRRVGLAGAHRFALARRLGAL